MRVWIDQDLCTGDGLCVDHCPDVFLQLEDGIAYVGRLDCPSTTRADPGHWPWSPVRNVQSVIHAAEACPGECIFIEIDPPVDAELDVTVDGRIAGRVDLRDDAA